LEGAAHPFDRLVALLSEGDCRAAGIDAPFSVPTSVAPANHVELLEKIRQVPCGDRPFPEAQAYLSMSRDIPQPRGRHELRETEAEWRHAGVNVRSTLWAGPRGGAAMTSACLKLLSRVKCPVWPFAQSSSGRLLVEAFPAAQLKTWRLPYQKYNGAAPEAFKNRETIVCGLEERVSLGDFRSAVIDNADALDAVVAAFAAIAVAEQRTGPLGSPELMRREGWIAVHREAW
jgi:hypothetical protein